MAINLTTKDSFSLPPHVIGKVRGIIIFKITDITINRTPNAVNIHLLWWGENVKDFQVLGPIRVTRKHNFQPVTLVYNIRTSLKLFYLYLSQCEPLKAEIFTAISNLKIGTSHIHIPQHLYNKANQNKAAKSFKINNDDGDHIGDLQVTFEIVLKEKEIITKPIDLIKYDLPTSKLTSKHIRKSHRSTSPINYGSEIQNNDPYTKYLKNKSDFKTQDDVRSVDSKDSTELAISSRENVLKFLHGEDMSQECEKQALKDIRNISPASSLIALADAEHCLTKNTKWTHCPSNMGSKLGSTSVNTQKDNVLKYLENLDLNKNAMDLKPSPKIKTNTHTKNAAIDNAINHIDSIRVTIQTLTLTSAGLRIVLGLENLPLVTISPNVTFFVEYSMPTIGKQSEHTSNLSQIRICAKSKDGQAVQFNRQSIHKVPLSEIMSAVPNSVIILNIYYRKLSQRQPKYLGHCRITLSEILNTSKFHSTRKCPIVTSREETDKDIDRKISKSSRGTNEKIGSQTAFSDVIGFGGILAGHLTVKIELGSNMLHFGKHFLESLTENQENISLSSTTTYSLHDNQPSTYHGETSDKQTNHTIHKSHHVQHPIERCAICRDYYADRPDSQKPHQHFVFERNTDRSKALGGKNYISHTDLCNKCSDTVLKRIRNGQVASSKATGFYLEHPKSTVQDSDDGKFVNTDLRGGKDLFGGMNEKKDTVTKKMSSKKGSYFKRDRGKIADMETETRTEKEAILLHGLLFVNEARGLEPQLLPQAYCLVNRGLSPGTGGSSKHMMCDGKYFQYLETFPLLCNKALMERCHSGHLIIEIWLKGPGPAQKLVGVASLPLHPFFVAYHDPSMVRYLEKVKLPVISVDGWIPLLSPISGTVSGEIQALLAMGTEKQLEELRTSRNLKPDLVKMLDDFPANSLKPNKAMRKINLKQPKVVSCSVGVNTSPIVVRQFATSISELNPDETSTKNSTDTDGEASSKNFNTVHTQTVGTEIKTGVEEETQIPPAISSNIIPLKKPHSFGNLSSFVEQLMTTLPEKTQFLTDVDMGTTSKSPTTSKHPQIKQTSELLDELQRALEHSPSIATEYAIVPETKMVSPKRLVDVNNRFRALIEIDQALHLSMVSVSTKKCNKRTKCKSRLKNTEIAPSAYVTFGGFGCTTVDAPEGPVIATKVVNNSCSPQWKERFEVMLPVDLLGESRNLVFKIWRKVGSSPTVSANATPNSDVVMGFAVIDLTILLSGLPSICGWFNINDVSHRCNGQIKISITPLESLAKFVTEESYCCSDNDTIHSLSSSINQDLTLDRITKSKEKLLALLQDLPNQHPPSKSPDKMDLCDNHIEKTNQEVQNQNHTGQKTPDMNLNIYSNKTADHNQVHQSNCDSNHHQISNMRCLNIEQSNRSSKNNTSSLLNNILNQNPSQEEDSLNTTSLSRVLKRKFTELHEITQRLRTRLLDVTADDDDEFERDLNTEGNEQEFDIRPEDFQTLAQVVSNAEPGEPKTFENLANDYQTMLAGKQSSVFRCNEQSTIDMEEMQKELDNNRDILAQRKCNINALLQKLTLISHPPQNPLIEKHVKFNSDIEIHDASSNIFDIISGTDFTTPFNKEPLDTESSIESTVTEILGDKEQENSNNFGFQNSSPIADGVRYDNQVLQRDRDSLGPSRSAANIGQHDYSNDQMGQFRQSVNDANWQSMARDSMMIQKTQEDKEDNSDDNSANVSVNDVIENILRITEQCPSSSKDTGFGQDDGSSSSKPSESGSEISRKDPDTTGIESDFDY